MTPKKLLRPNRLRRVPSQFSWLDHRLVRENRLAQCGPPALALYLVLVTVGDSQGLSYYSDAALGRLIGLSPDQVVSARQPLLRADLIAYQKPLYQVLSLDPPPTAPTTPRSQEARSAGQLLRQILGGSHD